MGGLNELLEKFGPQGFLVIALASEDRQTVEEFMKSFGVRYVVGLDEGQRTSEAYETQGMVPFAYLIGRDRKVAWQGHAMELEEERVKALLAAAPKSS